MKTGFNSLAIFVFLFLIAGATNSFAESTSTYQLKFTSLELERDLINGRSNGGSVFSSYQNPGILASVDYSLIERFKERTDDHRSNQVLELTPSNVVEFDSSSTIKIATRSPYGLDENQNKALDRLFIRFESYLG